ncbi:MAG: hypothetical protein K9L24_00560, partial [Spirochaetia bacterium]|nr:hypothetical protein [Spirochaetia bacterium]MCF7952584.1 hypothetical protein [Spirochaetales bacterium]
MHNFRKPFLINDRTDERHITHAIKAGIDPELIRKNEKGLFTRRAWFSREQQNLSETQRRAWLREFETPEGTGNPYNPKFMAA